MTPIHQACLALWTCRNHMFFLQKRLTDCKSVPKTCQLLSIYVFPMFRTESSTKDGFLVATAHACHVAGWIRAISQPHGPHHAFLKSSKITPKKITPFGWGFTPFHFWVFFNQKVAIMHKCFQHPNLRLSGIRAGTHTFQNLCWV